MPRASRRMDKIYTLKMLMVQLRENERISNRFFIIQF